jgi:hypothetical protein
MYLITCRLPPPRVTFDYPIKQGNQQRFPFIGFLKPQVLDY